MLGTFQSRTSSKSEDQEVAQMFEFSRDQAFE